MINGNSFKPLPLGKCNAFKTGEGGSGKVGRPRKVVTKNIKADLHLS